MTAPEIKKLAIKKANNSIDKIVLLLASRTAKTHSFSNGHCGCEYCDLKEKIVDLKLKYHRYNKHDLLDSETKAKYYDTVTKLKERASSLKTF